MIRRLERLEGDLLAERHARVDDLALLVDLISVGLAGRRTTGSSASSAADERGARRRRAARSPHRDAALASGASGSTSRKRLPLPDLGLELDPAAERDRELRRDRRGPSPVPRPSCDQNGRKIRSRSSGAIPGPVSSTATATVPFARLEREVDPAAVGRPAERVREQVRDDLEHAVAVRDDHRRRRRPRAVVDPAPPRLLAERRVGALDQPAPCRPPRSRTVNRCASSFARSSTSPTSRSSRSASAATISSDASCELRVLDDALAQRGDVAADRGQRRAQLVRDGHQEVALELLRLGEPRGHLAEPLGEVADLAAAGNAPAPRRRSGPRRPRRRRARARAPAR